MMSQVYIGWCLHVYSGRRTEGVLSMFDTVVLDFDVSMHTYSLMSDESRSIIRCLYSYTNSYFHILVIS